MTCGDNEQAVFKFKSPKDITKQKQSEHEHLKKNRGSIKCH